MKALRWLSWFPLLVLGCTQATARDAKFAGDVAMCKERVNRECKWTVGEDGREHPNEDCPELIECDRMTREYEAGQ